MEGHLYSDYFFQISFNSDNWFQRRRHFNFCIIGTCNGNIATPNDGDIFLHTGIKRILSYFCRRLSDSHFRQIILNSDEWFQRGFL